MKLWISLLLCWSWATATHAMPTNSFPLWPHGAPGALGDRPEDIPTLTPYPAETRMATGAAFIVCPGGGYEHLAPHEGETYARWLNAHGVTAFVLKYRLGTSGYHHPAMLQDVTRAIRLVRSQAVEWRIDPHRIGIIGSSAGGHLASTLLTHFDAGIPGAADPVERVSSRPDLGVLCYAVITMGPFTHEGSRSALLGPHPSPELVRELSNELHVTKDTPPCFIWHTDEDTTVPVENSLMFAEALRKEGVPFELHIYQKGGHGQGLGVHEYTPRAEPHLLRWAGDCIAWLKVHGYAR
jgi:acetyl esterase/lipase